MKFRLVAKLHILLQATSLTLYPFYSSRVGQIDILYVQEETTNRTPALYNIKPPRSLDSYVVTYYKKTFWTYCSYSLCIDVGTGIWASTPSTPLLNTNNFNQFLDNNNNALGKQNIILTLSHHVSSHPTPKNKSRSRAKKKIISTINNIMRI